MILVTGSNGNLGSTLERRFRAHGIEVRGVSRQNWDKLPELIRGVDAVVHAAGDIQSSLYNSLSKVLQSNIMTTSELLELSAQERVKRFYFVSSCAVYGDASITSEDVAPDPVSFNGRVKRLNEEFIAEYCGANGITHTSFRLFNIYGGFDHFSILHHLRESSRLGTAFKMCNRGVSRRDFLHVEDAAELIIRCIFSDSTPSVLNIGTGVTTSVAELVEKYQSMHPSLQVEYTFGTEVEYSRADTTLLRQVIGHYDFKDILNELNELNELNDPGTNHGRGLDVY